MTAIHQTRSSFVLSLSGVLILAILLLSMTDSGFAQAKKKTVPPKPAVTEQAAPEQSSRQQGSGGSLKVFMDKYRTSRTNLGILTRVEADYFVVDDDGMITIYPFARIESIKIHKTEEGEENPISIDIKMQ